MKKMRITQKSIAEQLGVSTMTVSRVLAGKTGNKVSPELIRKIQTAAKNAGYHENRLAKAMRTGEVPLSALCLHRMNHFGEQSSYWLDLMSNYTEVLFEHQRETLFIPYDSPEELEKRLTALSSAGLISSAAANIMPGKSAEVTAAMQAVRLPYVLLGNPADKTVPYVYVDNDDINAQLLDMLRPSGAKDLIWFSEDMPLPDQTAVQNPDICFQVSSIAGFTRLNRMAKIPESRIFLVTHRQEQLNEYSGFLVRNHTKERCRRAWHLLELQKKNQPVPDEMKIIRITPDDIMRINMKYEI